ncbi:uncharacterized protein METZ01_LOCUS400708, partial [marine metagenome]
MQAINKTCCRVVFLACLLIGIGGCSGLFDWAMDDDKPAEDAQGVVWADVDNPEIVDFTSSFKYKLLELPNQGSAEIPPWAGSYWPTYRDSINYN